MRRWMAHVTAWFLIFILVCLASRLAASAGADVMITTEVSSSAVVFKCSKGCDWKEKKFACFPAESSCLFRVSGATIESVATPRLK